MSLEGKLLLRNLEASYILAHPSGWAITETSWSDSWRQNRDVQGPEGGG